MVVYDFSNSSVLKNTMESSQSGFQLEQLKLNLFFWGCFDPSASYQHKRRTTFLTAAAALCAYWPDEIKTAFIF